MLFCESIWFLNVANYLYFLDDIRQRKGSKETRCFWFVMTARKVK